MWTWGWPGIGERCISIKEIELSCVWTDIDVIFMLCFCVEMVDF